jgi:CIC family chloride channel protein
MIEPGSSPEGAQLEAGPPEPAHPDAGPEHAPARWRRWIRRTIPSGSGFESTRNLTKWFLLSAAIGVAAGLGAIVFYLAIQYATAGFLGTIVGYHPPSPMGEGTPGTTPILRPWLLPLVAALGGLLSGAIVFGLAPEAEGHGTDAAIDAIHHHGGRIRARIPPIKLIASAITIGSGGSGGREGPAAQISSGFGSLLGHWLHLDVIDRRIAVAAGIGAGIGAIFRAPLGGALLAAEILYVHDLEVEAIIPALIAGIIGYTIYGAYFGFTPIFGQHAGLALGSPIQLLYYAVLGALSGLFGILYARTFYGTAHLFHRVKVPQWTKPAVGGLLVGLMGIAVPQALHMGYGWVQLVMTSPTLLALPLWVILVLPAAKILATSLSIGSGGAGGIFGPGMVIGGMLGAAFWRLGSGHLPAMPVQPAPFVIVGMMALFGGIAHAPLAVMLMVAEMTGNLSLLAPAMVAVAVSTVLVGDTTIYSSQLRDRASAPVHRLRFSFPMLSALRARDAMAPAPAVVRPDAPLEMIRSLVAPSDMPGVVVVDDRKEVVGVISRARLPSDAGSDRAVLAQDVMEPVPVTVDSDQPLDTALGQLAQENRGWAPVVDDGRPVGTLTIRDVVRAYKSTLRQGVRRAAALPGDMVLVEARIETASPLAGRTLRDAGLPSDTLVISVSRDGETIFPRAVTELAAGDIVTMVTNRTAEGALRNFLEGRRAAGRSAAQGN